MEELKLDSRNRRRVKYCPCNKSNKDGKFVPYSGYEQFGYCHSCGKTMLPEDGVIETPIEIKEEPTFTHNPLLVSEAGRNFDNNNFISYLISKFDKEKVKVAILRYLIGTSKTWKGATVFWQIDDKNNVRNGKIMLYGPETGKRSKNHFNTVRSLLNLREDGHKLRQCLFGLHLLNETNNRTIGVVESEKTAIIMSLVFEGYTWMATGGKGNFNYNMLNDIKAFKIVAFPDMDAIDEWKETALKLSKYGFDIEIDDTIKTIMADKNADLADVFMEPSSAGIQKPKPLLTEQDLLANKLLSNNKMFNRLINEFDLVHENGMEINLGIQ